MEEEKIETPSSVFAIYQSLVVFLHFGNFASKTLSDHCVTIPSPKPHIFISFPLLTSFVKEKNPKAS